MSIKEDFYEMSSQLTASGKLKIIILLVLILGLLAPVLYNLTQTWSTSDDYSHGFFVLPIAVFMVWKKRQKLIEAKSSSSWGWLPFLIIVISSYMIAIATNFHTLSYLSMILVILFLILFISGWEITKLIILPLLFLIFMFPIPNSYYILITNPLKLMITSLSAGIIGLFKIPVFQEGNLLFFADTQLEVAEACSGIRSLYSYIMLSCVIALMCDKLSSKIILILSTIPLAIFVNIMRVTGTGVLANYYGPEVAQGFFHEFTGFVLFIIGFVALFALYYLLEQNIFHRLRRLH